MKRTAHVDTSWNDYSLCWTPPLGWCFLRRGSTTSVRYFASYTGWRLQNGSSISSPFWFTSASTEWRRRIWQVSFSSRRTLPPGHGFVRHCHCSFAVHGCRLSATERFRSLLPLFGTVCRVMSPPLHRCLSTVAAWRVTFSSSPFTTPTLVVPAQWLLSFQTL